MNRKHICRSAAGLFVLGLAGCAGMPPPEKELALARSGIEQASGAGATRYAPAELAGARDSLSQAEAAMHRGENELALRMAEKAAVDARLAETRAQLAHAQQALAEVQRGVATLKQELLRAN